MKAAGSTPAASSPPPGRTCRCPQSPRKPSPERRFLPPAQAPPRATPEEPSADPATTKPSRMHASILNGNRARRQEGGENGYMKINYLACSERNIFLLYGRDSIV